MDTISMNLMSLILKKFSDMLVQILLSSAMAWYYGDEGGEMEMTTFASFSG